MTETDREVKRFVRSRLFVVLATAILVGWFSFLVGYGNGYDKGYFDGGETLRQIQAGSE